MTVGDDGYSEPWPECVYTPVNGTIFRCSDTDGEGQNRLRGVFHEDIVTGKENIWEIYLYRTFHDLSVSYESDDRKILDVIEKHTRKFEVDYSNSYTPNDTIIGTGQSALEEGELYSVNLRGDVSRNCRKKTCSCYDHLDKGKCPQCDSIAKHPIADASGTEYCSVGCLNESKTEKHVR